MKVRGSEGQETRLELGDGLLLPKRVATERMAIVANPGAGKSYTGMKLAELMLSIFVPVVVLDPQGIWWGLLSDASGKKPGFPIYIFGGTGKGRIGLSPKGGAAMATMLVETGISAVLDVSDFLPHELHQFVIDFTTTLLRERKRKPRAMHLFLEEAHNFSPQRMKGGGSFEMVIAVAKLLKEGRHGGIGWTLITQRAQDVDKMVLDLAETLIAMRTGAGWKRVKEWLNAQEVKEHTGLQAELAKLPTGDAIIISPSFLKTTYRRVHVARRVTFDSSRTPEVDEVREEPKLLAPADLEKIRALMADTLEKVEEGTPAAMQRRIAELEHQLREEKAKPRHPVSLPAPPPERVEVPVLKPEDFTRWEKSVHQVLTGAEELKQHGASVLAALQRVAHHAPTPVPAPRPKATTKKAATPKQAPEGEAQGELEKGPRSMLKTLANFGGRVSRVQLGLWSGYAPKVSSFRNHLSTLHASAYVEKVNGEVELTETGTEYAAGLGDEGVPTTSEAAIDMWKGKLEAGPRKMLEVLAVARGWLTREQLGEQSGYDPAISSFRNHLSTLHARSLVEKRGKLVRIAQELLA